MMANRTKLTAKKRKEFLRLLRRTGNVSMCSKAIGISRSSMYKHRDTDEKLRAAWDEAIEESTDRMILEAQRRAVKGCRKPVYYLGNIVGHIREHSDSLLMFLIKGRRPEYATERRELSGRGGGPIPHEHGLSPALQAKLDEHYKSAKE
jgi:hypothetical protein